MVDVIFDAIFQAFGWLLTAHFMLFIWSLTIAACVFVSVKTKSYGIMVLAGGVTPFLIFYTYRLFGLWPPGPIVVIYSRVAGAALAVSIILSLWLMHRSMYDESRRPPSS